MTETALSHLRSELITHLDCYPCVHLGFESIDIKASSGYVVSVRSVEVADTAFEAYTIQVTEGRSEQHDPSLGDVQHHGLQLRVDRIEVFRRAEWEEFGPVGHSTVGEHPVMINTGPVGAAPKGAPSVVVICGLSCWGENEDQPALWVFLADYPGVVALSIGAFDSACYRNKTSREFVP